MTLSRDLLAQALGGNPRLVRAFEEESQTLARTSEAVTSTLSATDALQDATVLTLSPNAAFGNERVLALGKGLGGTDADGRYTIALTAAVPEVSGGFTVTFYVAGDAKLALPFKGRLATTDQREVLFGKTLSAPKVSAVEDFADDAAAGAGGVEVGQVYRTGSALKVRLA